MSVTIKDIAKKAGVAHTTVSRALNGSPLIAAATTQRILEIARELGYNPSAAARSLKTNRSQVIGVIVPNIDDPFFSEILQGIEEVTLSSGYSVFISASQRSPQREHAIVQTMNEHRIDGFIICSTSFSPEQSSLISQYGIPIVVINNQSAEDYRYSIYHDDLDGSRTLTRHLIELGHRRIAYLGNSLSGRSTQDRTAGFLQEMKQAGLEVPEGYVHQVEGGSAESGLQGLAYFLSLPARPTALLCYNDMMAIGVLQGLQQAGLRVPQDMSVTGFDNIVFSAYTNPRLTTFDQPKRSIGNRAARLVLELLDTQNHFAPDSQPNVIMLQGALLPRESTAPPSPSSSVSSPAARR